VNKAWERALQKRREKERAAMTTPVGPRGPAPAATTGTAQARAAAYQIAGSVLRAYHATDPSGALDAIAKIIDGTLEYHERALLAAHAQEMRELRARVVEECAKEFEDSAERFGNRCHGGECQVVGGSVARIRALTKPETP